MFWDFVSFKLCCLLSVSCPKNSRSTTKITSPRICKAVAAEWVDVFKVGVLVLRLILIYLREIRSRIGPSFKLLNLISTFFVMLLQHLLKVFSSQFNLQQQLCSSLMSWGWKNYSCFFFSIANGPLRKTCKESISMLQVPLICFYTHLSRVLLPGKLLICDLFLYCLL